VTTQSQRPAAPYAKAQDPLAACLIGLAGTPDDSSWIGSQLMTIAHLSADLIEPVHYASITAYRDDRFTTVATSSPIVLAVDQAQYSAQAGPCLDALDTGSPIAVPDVAATATWLAFRYSALRLGIRASLSIPLFAGRGTAVAGLNLYGRNPATMAPLTAAVRAAYDPDDDGASPQRRGLDDGGSALVAGIAGAFAVRARIQQALGAVMAATHRTPDAAYLMLRLRAAEAGTTLIAAATAVLTERC
jgi:hypothetical protein